MADKVVQADVVVQFGGRGERGRIVKLQAAAAIRQTQDVTHLRLGPQDILTIVPFA